MSKLRGAGALVLQQRGQSTRSDNRRRFMIGSYERRNENGLRGGPRALMSPTPRLFHDRRILALKSISGQDWRSDVPQYHRAWPQHGAGHGKARDLRERQDDGGTSVLIGARGLSAVACRADDGFSVLPASQ